MIRNFFRRFYVKVSLAFILSLCFISVLSNFLIYRYALNAQFEQLRENLISIAQTAALLIDAETVQAVPLQKQGMETAAFQHLFEQIRLIRKVNPLIWSVYIMARTPEPAVLQFVVDSDIPDKTEIEKGITFYPGDRYDASRFPEMLKAFAAPTADRTLGTDEWATVLSGYAPIRDRDGRAVAIVGVDILANSVSRLQQTINQRAVAVLAIGIMLSLVLGMLLAQGITTPVRRLIAGTQRISRDDLKFQIENSGDDEIGDLTKSFNKMAHSLSVSKEKLHNYFYNVMQSLVRILEAKDAYTRGHSERVAEYTEKIARRMKMPEERIALLKDAALLHDIGKLGIHESILNKQGALTAEEWEQVRQHPLIGEDILKPVILSREMLEVVRWHHERFDGTGYPDRLSGKNISQFAAIIAIADAYDAMMSHRAYRRALHQEKVIEELLKNRGSQFDGAIMDIFLSILEEEQGSAAAS